jgi:DNA polymerase/3'-5' exonuclease PolX
VEESDHHQEGKSSLDNAGVAQVLQQIADMLEFKNENPFKLRSYQMAAETIGSMGTPIAEIAERGGAAETRRPAARPPNRCDP